MKWPWHRRQEIAAQRQEAEARAEEVHEEVIRPLREMRQKDRLTPAIIAEIRAQLRQEGDHW